MNKTELVNSYARKQNLTKKESLNCINALCELIKETVKNGENVCIKDFGVFELKYRAQKTGINPRTGKPITIRARKVPTFKATQGFKDAVNYG